MGAMELMSFPVILIDVHAQRMGNAVPAKREEEFCRHDFQKTQ